MRLLWVVACVLAVASAAPNHNRQEQDGRQHAQKPSSVTQTSPKAQNQISQQQQQKQTLHQPPQNKQPSSKVQPVKQPTKLPPVQPAPKKPTNFVVQDVHMIVTPLLCPPGEKETSSGCRPVFRRKRLVTGGPEPKISTKPEEEEPLHAVPQCIIGCQLPPVCPPGQKPDASGVCRDNWDDY